MLEQHTSHTEDSGETYAVREVKKAFNFEVELRPVVAVDPKSGNGSPGNADATLAPWHAVCRTDTGKVVSRLGVGRNYKPHQTKDIIALVRACESVFGKSQGVATHFNYGHHVAMKPSDEFRRRLVEEESVFPCLVINAGYGGKAFECTLEIYRDFCDNLVMLQSLSTIRKSFRHTPGLTNRIDGLAKKFFELKIEWGQTVDLIDQMQKTQVDFREFLEGVYPQTGEGEDAQKAREERIDNVICSAQRRVHDKLDGKVSAWEAYNAVQGYYQWDAPRRDSRLQNVDRQDLFAADDAPMQVSGGFSPMFDRVLRAAREPAVKRAEKLAFDAIE